MESKIQDRKMTTKRGPTIWRGHAALYQCSQVPSSSDQMTGKTTRALALIFWQDHQSQKTVQIFGPILYAAIAALWQCLLAAHIFWQNTRAQQPHFSDQTTGLIFRASQHTLFFLTVSGLIFRASQYTHFFSDHMEARSAFCSVKKWPQKQGSILAKWRKAVNEQNSENDRRER